MTEKKVTEKSSIFDRLRSKSMDQREMVSLRVEKKPLVRIVEAKPKAIRHMSESIGEDSLSEDGLRITEAVVEGVASAPERAKRAETRSATPAPKPVRAFSCLACGAPMPVDSHTCPRCHAKYLLDLLPQSVADLEYAESTLAGSRDYGEDDGEDLGFDEFPVIYFDAEGGVMNYLEHKGGESDFVLECINCNTLIQLDIDRCPLCGHPLEVSDVGLLNLIQGSDFDEGCPSELECPHCGEHVTLRDGCCPACESVIVDLSPGSPGKKVVPLIKAENVVFIHIDLETGDLNFLQKHLNRVAIEHASIQLDGIGNDGVNEDWRSQSRT